VAGAFYAQLAEGLVVSRGGRPAGSSARASVAPRAQSRCAPSRRRVAQRPAFPAAFVAFDVTEDGGQGAVIREEPCLRHTRNSERHQHPGFNIACANIANLLLAPWRVKIAALTPMPKAGRSNIELPGIRTGGLIGFLWISRMWE
jgi:hypothetical protein